MAILPASLTENTNSHTANNPTNISIISTSNSHYHQQHQRYQQQHNQQQQQQQHQRHHSPNSPPASPHHRKPKYYQQHQQQQSPPYRMCTRRQSISSEDDLPEFSSSSSTSSLFYDEDFSSSSSIDDDDHHRNLKNTRIKSSPHSPPRSLQCRYYNYNRNNYSNNSYNASPPRTPNKNANNNDNNNNNNKYMHSYKKPVMPARNLYLAMDCEMIQTIQHESIAARVVLVDWKGRTVLDTYIQHPAEQVVDYKTFVSGITPQHLEDAPSFAHVRQQVRDLLQDKILVGHGLENDLKALQIMDHPWWMIRDTAYYQPFMQERVVPGSNLWMPRKLRDLVQEKLPQCYDNDFQKDGTAHCPTADAKAALDLYKSHRPRWEACMIQHVKKNTLLPPPSQQQQQGFMMMSPCSVMMMPSHKLQEHQQSPMMSPQQMAMMLPTPALALSSPMASAAVAAAAPFYSSPSPSQSHSARSSKSVWPSSRQQEQRSHPTFTALPSLPF